MGNHFCSKNKAADSEVGTPLPADGSQHVGVLSTFSDTVVATAGTSLPPAPVTIDVGSPISERDSSPSGKGLADDYDDEEAEEQKITEQKSAGRRPGVSAEAYTVERMDTYQAPVYPKTPEEISTIKSMLSSDQGDSRKILFGHMRDSDLEKIALAMRRKDVNQGESIIRQGDFGDAFYIVERGTFDIFVKRGNKEPLKVVFVYWASFGELALMYNAPRAATVTATSDAKLWSLDRECFQLMVVTSENTKKKKYESFLEKVPILADLNKYELAQLSDMLTSEVFSSGEVIVKQGDVSGDKFYILESGECIASISGQEGEVEVKRYTKPGDYFGEIALLKHGEPRKATVKAADDKKGCRVLSVGREEFNRVLGPITDVLRKNASKYPSYKDFLTITDDGCPSNDPVDRRN
ncbi:cAMP-dependent protein kinase regulatory subunit, putative [Perkinsus marinus ATCC 50983]|uniref:cAMP-dependent protein kinase regulatory subunit, putative n=1 Tax=Perkinsus marinus (strain ATCC 50983 / TXsc) TaxID=423536 RepID=C5K5U9_PERM5|nr:cAMP-dependent protein kinase regulatory subunit, putative [Perkinsus marinus ATCC 50983]XP_002788349.1 cAMP-dependent protein kinase regulatory subunit, putative [Perkinsus marinus ATCC 50983]EER17472.1 cAMP-dependent protein kinase regulatory subunit, putative [Perkinsus marinus ATCC 50983]EER20145.1 cAMP-dependent protein kinase regulatory subunit, putative [Perkinsus marinus ATCC 50983]|eukprot:XP_002785676.1 cAMP-dependent protein kinase regulatory subunit, putative [Perkinsus marinus ATCC 50983]